MKFLLISLLIVVAVISIGVLTINQPSVTYTLIATDDTAEYIPGISTKTFEFNKQLPGPILYGNVGETLRIKVKNHISEPITVHWHGMQLKNSMDGVPGVTQEPIAPGSSFIYEFTPRNSGVYWYHSHVDAHKQVEMGLQGSLVIYEKNKRIYADTDTVLVLDDVAINQDGSYASFDLNYMHGRFGNILLVNGENNPTISLGGKTHRFRIINTANARSFQLSFEDNPIKVIGGDIGYVSPYNTTKLIIHPGQRYDILVDAQSSLILTHVTSRETIRLASLSITNHFSNSDTINAFDYVSEGNLPEEAYAMEPTTFLELQGVRDPQHGLVWNIGGANSLTNPQTISYKENDLIKIRLKNTQGQPHPMHLHGQKFQVLTRNGAIQPGNVWSDTVMVNGGEEVDIAFIAEEQGEWVFHCHILEHAKAGMLTSITVI